jgi:hypothetical protein
MGAAVNAARGKASKVNATSVPCRYDLIIVITIVFGVNFFIDRCPAS